MQARRDKALTCQRKRSILYVSGSKWLQEGSLVMARKMFDSYLDRTAKSFAVYFAGYFYAYFGCFYDFPYLHNSIKMAVPA